jgi:hypothetical protein
MFYDTHRGINKAVTLEVIEDCLQWNEREGVWRLAEPEWFMLISNLGPIVLGHRESPPAPWYVHASPTVEMDKYLWTVYWRDFVCGACCLWDAIEESFKYMFSRSLKETNDQAPKNESEPVKEEEELR